MHCPGMQLSFPSVSKSRFAALKGLRSHLQIPALCISVAAKSFKEVVDFVIEVCGEDGRVHQDIDIQEVP